MSRISVDHLAAAIRKVRSMSLEEKEALAEEIHRRQPHMLASCLVQSRLGVAPAAVEFLLHILLVCYQSMKEVRQVRYDGIHELGELASRVLPFPPPSMGNTWIVDIRHYLDQSGAFADICLLQQDY